MVCSSGTSRWEWCLVVPLSADESRARRLRRGPTRDAGSGLGYVVSAGRKAAKLHSGIFGGGSGAQRARAKSISFSTPRQCNRRKFLPRRLASRRTHRLLGSTLPFHVSRNAERQRLDRFLADAS